MHKIHASLLPLAVDIRSLVLDPTNARKHGQKNLDAIKASLLEHGQRQVVVVQQEGMIVRAGNARVQAARELGWDKIAALIVDDSTLQAIRYGLVDNRTAELADWDIDILSELLKGLDAENALDGLGWSDKELDRLIGTSDFEIPGEAMEEPKPKKKSLRFTEEQMSVVDRAVRVFKDREDTEGETEADVITVLCGRYVDGEPLAKTRNTLLEDKFIAEYIKALGVKTKAAEATGVAYRTVLDWFKNEDFLARLRESEDQWYDALRASLMARAMKKSDTLGMFFLKARDPETYHDDIRKLKYAKENNIQLAETGAPVSIVLVRDEPPEHIRREEDKEAADEPAH